MADDGIATVLDGSGDVVVSVDMNTLLSDENGAFASLARVEDDAFDVAVIDAAFLAFGESSVFYII